MVDIKSGFNLTFAENLKQNANSSPTKELRFDDLGDFIEERKKIQRIVENSLNASLKVDYSDFSNHVFFDSAVSKFNIAKSKILNNYPYNGTLEEKDAFFLTSSNYEQHIFSEWPKYTGYVNFNGVDQYISASDLDNDLVLITSSLYLSAWIRPVISNQNMIIQVMSASTSPVKKYGYEFYLSSSVDPFIKFSIYSGSQRSDFSASYLAYSSSFNNVSVIYDYPTSIVSLYINNTKQVSGSVNFGSLEFKPTKVVIASGSQFTANSSSYNFYSGSIDEVRIAHTSSELYHIKNYNKPIDSDSFLKLNYSFNEGITGTGSVDSVIVDYSKNNIHGVFYNYGATSRTSGSVLNNDFGNPILYSFHSGVMSFTSSIDLSASLYDVNNNNFILNLLPEAILNEDSDGILNMFALSMARYFDQLKLYVDQFDNLRITNYESVNETPDLMLPLLSKYFGWKVTDHFGDINPLSFLLGQNVIASSSLEVPFYEIRNQFWRRILNNLPYLFKTKGKRVNLDSFFNVLGINKSNFSIKEYGFVPNKSIQTERINKNKPISVLGIGTGSIPQTGSYVKIPFLIGNSPLGSDYTVESLIQLPHVSASFSSSIVTGSIWQFMSNTNTDSFTLLWKRSLTSDSGSFILTSSDGQVFSSSDINVFSKDFVYLACGLNNSIPFIEIRILDNTDIRFSSSFVGISALSMSFTGSNYDFIIGANSGSVFSHGTQGYFSEFRVWSRYLSSSSEILDHALNFQSIGINNPLELPNPLLGQWSLNENISSSLVGNIFPVQDYSRNNHIGTGSLFPVNYNSYNKFLFDYNYISPSIDLKWNDNKIRVRNKTQLSISEVANDTNEVSLEFNLIDSLNEDISKIFSTFDIINQIIGIPTNKYRDEYSDLENLRRVYFDRLTTSLNFTNFFKLFRWFDNKLSDSIKQLLPARVKFIGGEQVVESHFLERPKYGYKYPIFRTPKPISEGSASAIPELKSDVQSVFYKELDSIVTPKVDISNNIVSSFSEGNDKVDRNPNNFFRTKYSGDQIDTINDSNTAVNYRNEFVTRSVQSFDRDNKDTINSNTGNIFINPLLGNANVIDSVDSSKNQEHYFSNAKKIIKMSIRGLSGSLYDLDKNCFALTGTEILDLSQSLYDINNVAYSGSGYSSYFNSFNSMFRVSSELKVRISASNVSFNVNDFNIGFKNANSDSFNLVQTFGTYTTESEGWHLFRYIFDRTVKPTFAINSSIYNFRIKVFSPKIYAFKDLEVNFDLALTDDGVEYFKNIDNQNTEKITNNLNQNVSQEIDDSIRNIKFVQFKNLNINDSTLRQTAAGTTYYTLSSANYKTGDIYLASANPNSGKTDWYISKINTNSPDNRIFIDSYINSGGSSNFYFIKVNQYDGCVYYSGVENGTVSILRRSTSGLSGTFQTVDSVVSGTITDIDFSGSSVYVCAVTGTVAGNTRRIILRNSSDGSSGSFSEKSSYTSEYAIGNAVANGISIRNNEIYICGQQSSSIGTEWLTLKSTQSGSNLSKVDTYQLTGSIGTISIAYKILANPYNTSVYVAGVANGSAWYTLRSSLNGNSGTFSTVDTVHDIFTPTFPCVIHGLDCDNRGRIYSQFFMDNDNNGNRNFIRRSLTNASGTFSNIINFGGTLDNYSLATSLQIDKQKKLAYLLRISNGSVLGSVTVPSVYGNFIGSPFVTRGLIVDNDEVFGKRMYNPCIFYPFISSSVALSDGNLDFPYLVKSKLLNISEFSLTNKSFVLGTQDAGTTGLTDDNLIKIKHVGSVVYVIWPKQGTQSFSNVGFGDLSSGQKIGTLTTVFSEGEVVDVNGYDHVTLYCYALKNEFGTNDNIEIKIQRRPLSSLGFTTEPLIEYGTSGSFATATLKDLIYKIPMDYSDLSLTEIGYPIDVPLVNTKEIRISARQMNGQTSSLNKNFIVWARLVKTKEET